MPGGSGAVEIALAALADAGQNVLVPQPGFSLYDTVLGNRFVATKRYRLLV